VAHNQLKLQIENNVTIKDIGFNIGMYRIQIQNQNVISLVSGGKR